MSGNAPAGETRAELPPSQRLLLWAPSVAVAIGLPVNFFAGFPVLLIVLGIFLIVFLFALRSVSGSEQRRG